MINYVVFYPYICQCTNKRSPNGLRNAFVWRFVRPPHRSLSLSALCARLVCIHRDSIKQADMQKIPFVTYFDSFLREPRAAAQIGSKHVTTRLVNHNWQFSLQIANVAVWSPMGEVSFLKSDTWRLDFEGMANVTNCCW